ncbi:hypothetical protein HPB47_017748 [Ixodes persulcatus]|uniref:Uncharacterized protein n=1 Tax=Ixodes persulcatus TaxID=34615 RepID=A0AC60QND5_IXOPE|nr:hypothetical protein HPB47_017748 [Ixodes persulcatus]
MTLQDVIERVRMLHRRSLSQGAVLMLHDAELKEQRIRFSAAVYSGILQFVHRAVVAPIAGPPPQPYNADAAVAVTLLALDLPSNLSMPVRANFTSLFEYFGCSTQVHPSASFRSACSELVCASPLGHSPQRNIMECVEDELAGDIRYVEQWKRVVEALFSVRAQCLSDEKQLYLDTDAQARISSDIDQQLQANAFTIAALMTDNLPLISRERWTFQRNEQWFEDTSSHLSEFHFKRAFRVSPATFRFLVESCRVSCRFLCLVLSESDALEDLARRIPNLETRLVQSWLRCCVAIVPPCDQMTRLSGMVLELKELNQLLLGTLTPPDGGESHDVFVIRLFTSVAEASDILSDVGDTAGTTRLQQTLALYLQDFVVTVAGVLKSSSATSAALQNVYTICGQLFKHCSTLLYTKGLSGCLLPQLLDCLVVPSVVHAKKPLSQAQLMALKHHLPQGVFTNSNVANQKPEMIP